MTFTLDDRQSEQLPREEKTPHPEGSGRNRWFLIVALVVVAAAAIAFGWWAFSGDGSDDAVDTEQTEQVATPDEPTETDGAAEATEATEAAENPIVASGFPIGRFVNEDGGGYRVLRFSDDGTFVINADGWAVNGTYTVDGDLYTELTNDAQPLAAEATYRWTFENGELTFELVGEDTNQNRRTFYTGVTYEGRVFVQTN